MTGPALHFSASFRIGRRSQSNEPQVPFNGVYDAPPASQYAGSKKTKSAEDGMIEWMNASAQRFSVILCLQSTSNN